ncbi:purine-nucleoside phosphorylase [Thermoflavimicrobium dichotomicum]|uniref:Purine nucleoside phosphorylase DeoD-type n=1 Tax=Thermoflavimicrobium dichotomicum TaxID=46223 RepID=A0A1I3LGT8_9BACL|nr:purine-nucleoside phosphorylase [Thermoflavimicrobium dichotomicum]SFI83949.1 purine-nucleoside phosphorylase [Thermoflavimicrobium dichotomicum]
MSFHLAAKQGEVAETVLLPGDPLRAKYIAETYLENPVCYNQVRGMFGYTGVYKGKQISVQGTGMGMPSISIYITELIEEYGVKHLIRIGTCGSIHPHVKVMDLILAMSASTNSGMNHKRLPGIDFAPTADFDLLQKAYKIALEKKQSIQVGSVFTSDFFYELSSADYKLLAKYQMLAVEMETAALYTIAAKHGVKALSMLTVSDHVFTKEMISSEQKEKMLHDMFEVALETAVSV